ncbi:hypothetical protein SAVERM_3105 [Streptomyces avermitilis MA-4680 = NBRC 14893]|uniref:Uncharacterized protein n=1 Tax=Streptomyces avermitilis (strain ATCC 31267 / DSM 46492 / JCM 5070 / NBRC 14893 / NCIMB 12804 / NRRL 8165 / MA-4680) TaxID=227882 RepID=Q82IM8_STRAW|nr:hypothetical protein SAVERM_3105 [Streptomyces avermitilis MA-4680 = NBRC 14893]
MTTTVTSSRVACRRSGSLIFGAKYGAAATANHRTKLQPALATGRGASEMPGPARCRPRCSRR